MARYEVKFKKLYNDKSMNGTSSSRTLELHSASESEALAKLRAQGCIRADDNVIILSIKPF